MYKQQRKIGEYKPIEYARRTLNGAETTFDEEFLAIVWACKHYRPYLLGRSLFMVTDHKPLVTILFRIKEYEATDARMRENHCCLSMILRSFIKAGAKNVNAYALSINPIISTVSKLEILPSKEERILKEMHVSPICRHQGINRTYKILNCM